MEQESRLAEHKIPERRVAVVCPKCARGYKIAPALLGRRLACKDCRHEWRARRCTPDEIRTALPAHRKDPSSELGRSPIHPGLPSAGQSIAIDMSWAGKQIGRYRARSLLGYGGMGVVWRAHDDALRRDVALKILTPTRDESKQNGMNLDLFMQEARAVAKLNHPAVVSIYEVAEDAGHVFLSLELMEGGTLKEFVDKNGLIEPRQLFRWMIGPAKALALAHRRGVIHRDIKPGNLMFDDHEHLKLMDFGLADVVNEQVSERLRGKAVGSLGWVSPETASGKATTAVSDVYSMGLVMLFALTGRQLIHAKSRTEIIAIHQNPPDPKLHEIKTLTPRGRRFLEKCLAVDPEKRLQSADELAAEVLALADEDPSEKNRRRKRGVSIAFVAAIVGIFAGVGTTAYYLLGLLKQQEQLSIPMPLPPAKTIQSKPRIAPAPVAPPAIPPNSAIAQEELSLQPGNRLASSSTGFPLLTEENKRKPWPDVLGKSIGAQFIASQRGSVFHRPDGICGGRKISYGNLVFFDSFEAAMQAGRTPCAECRPQPLEAQPSVVVGPSNP
ncbi:MAG TPA: protein kinase [Phycisphaerae bacterium]|nr:protein kinase [Phycisphaerae bacterium]